MERVGSLMCQFEGTSVTDVPDGERWTHRSIVCTAHILKKYFLKGCLRVSLLKNPLGVS